MDLRLGRILAYGGVVITPKCEEPSIFNLLSFSNRIGIQKKNSEIMGFDSLSGSFHAPQGLAALSVLQVTPSFLPIERHVMSAS